MDSGGEQSAQEGLEEEDLMGFVLAGNPLVAGIGDQVSEELLPATHQAQCRAYGKGVRVEVGVHCLGVHKRLDLECDPVDAQGSVDPLPENVRRGAEGQAYLANASFSRQSYIHYNARGFGLLRL
jgi:hypothetical protein